MAEQRIAANNGFFSCAGIDIPCLPVLFSPVPNFIFIHQYFACTIFKPYPVCRDIFSCFFVGTICWCIGWQAYMVAGVAYEQNYLVV